VSKSGFCEEPATKEKLMADKPESNEEKAPEAPAPKQAKRSPEGNNRNSLRSLHLLEQSYLNLIMRKPVDKITVADITREWAQQGHVLCPFQLHLGARELCAAAPRR
jgi:hypothetical protein